MNEARASKIAERLFIGKRPLRMRLNDGDLPEGFAGALYTEVRTVLDWRDRLRLIFGAHLITETVTYCEGRPGRVESHSETHVIRPRTIRSGTGGTVEGRPWAAEEPQD